MPLWMWYMAACALTATGCFSGYAGARFYLAGYVEPAIGLILLGVVMGGWGLVVLWRCRQNSTGQAPPD